MNKDNFKDLEKEAEAEAYNKIRPVIDEKTKQSMRDIRDLATSNKADWERFDRFKEWLFMRYCNKNKLTDRQAEVLRKDQFKKENSNSKVWGDNAILKPEGGLTMNIKYLSSKKEEENYWVHNCNVQWICMFPGCHELTALLLSGPHDRWDFQLCSKHYEEYKDILKTKPYHKW